MVEPLWITGGQRREIPPGTLYHRRWCVDIQFCLGQGGTIAAKWAWPDLAPCPRCLPELPAVA